MDGSEQPAASITEIPSHSSVEASTLIFSHSVGTVKHPQHNRLALSGYPIEAEKFLP